MSRPGRRATARSRYNELAGTSLDRLGGISDGIFAVSMTLLVLGLAVPTLTSAPTERGLWDALVSLAPNALVYAMSFVTLGIFRVGQGTQLGQLDHGNRHYTWIQLGFLLAVTLVPFSTALLARYHELRVALLVYWLNVVLLGAALLAGLAYAHHARLLTSPGGDVISLMRGRILIAQALYAAATALCIFFPTLAASSSSRSSSSTTCSRRAYPSSNASSPRAQAGRPPRASGWAWCAECLAIRARVTEGFDGRGRL